MNIDARQLQSRYKVTASLGEGSTSRVWRATRRENAEVVAIKQFTKNGMNKSAAREMALMQSLRHQHIIRLLEIIRENETMFMIFEWFETTLHDQLEQRRSSSPPMPLDESVCRGAMLQLLSAVSYCHSQGVAHRDLKPQNVLTSHDLSTVKLCDFGGSRGVRRRQLAGQPPLTEYVSTRWFRAPEVLLRSRSYGTPIDMWALGAILAEVLTLEPIFPGATEADQLYRIACTLGPPSKWGGGLDLARQRGVSLPSPPAEELRPLASFLRSASSDAVQLVTRLLQWDPEKRPSAKEALRHRFFVRSDRSGEGAAAAGLQPHLVYPHAERSSCVVQ